MDKHGLARDSEAQGIDYFLEKISQHYPPRNSHDELLLEIYEQLCEKHFGSGSLALRTGRGSR
jgi:hypothetical protein